jgi:hypothetical protein
VKKQKKRNEKKSKANERTMRYNGGMPTDKKKKQIGLFTILKSRTTIFNGQKPVKDIISVPPT